MNVLFYVDESALKNESDTTNYVINAIKDIFNTEVCTTEDINKIKDANVIFNRFDIPWNKEFLLEQHKKYNDGSRLFVNDPLSKINLQSKEYLLDFPNLIPTTLFSNNIDEIVNFITTQEDIVIKPYDENKAKGIKHIFSHDYSKKDLYLFVNDYLEKYDKAIVQDYIQGVEKLGDKRINVINYEPVSAMLRLPKEGSFLCNVAAGGDVVKTDITESDRYIVKQLEPFFRKHNLPWVGVDVIGSYLGEFNISSPGGLYRADVLLNNNSASLDAVVNMLKNYEKNS